MILPICFMLAIVASVGGVTPGYLNLNLLGDGVGYFMKPYYPLKNNDSVQEWPFVAMAGASVLRATYGPFEAQQDISQSILNQTAYSQHTPLNYQTVNGMSISAHVVTETILPDRPLQVLFHVSLSAKRVNSNSSEPSPPTSLCFAVYATKDNKTLSSSCLINDTSEVCIAEVILPLNWWSDKLAQTVDVSYLVYGNTASSCSNGKNPSGNRVFLSGVTLTQGQMSYQEMKEDQHILIYVPQAVFSPGARFRVPVKLQAESDLEAFAIRVKTKQGIKIIGAQAKNSSRDSWQVQTDVNMKQQNAVVAARAVENYSKTSRIQDIFDWIFEVDDTNSNADRCRLSFSIEYEMSFGHRVKYGVIENKATVRIQIHQDKTFAIVPVVKTIELINTALLTGKPQSYPLRIFSISYSGQIQDITTQTTCHSGDETVLKVDESCGTIFLTDQETKGSSSVSIIAKHGRHTRFLFLKVWVPELPLEIDLSDSKLSQVVGWRVPAPEPARPASSEPGRTVADERLKNLDDQSSCQLRYQSSLVDVYARFITSDDIQNPYLLHRNAMFRITNLVRDRIRSADESVALVKGVVVDGLKPGRTEIQVMSRSGRVIAAKQFKVSNEKVNINRMEANVVSGLKLSMDTKSDYPGSLTARLSVMRMLNRKDQEAFVDVVLGFDDETVLPLWAVPQSHYILDIEVSDDSVIQAQLTTVQSIVVPKVIASAAGAKQSLKMKFSASGACPLPKMRPMAISHSVINVEIVDKKMKVTTTENPGGLYKGWPESSSNTLPKQEAHMSSKTASSSSGIRLSSMEMAMYILLLIFCIAAAVFAVNCMLFAARRKRLFKVKGDVDSVCEVENDWVWIGHKTLERNAVNTTCLETLMPDADFNGNSNNQGPLMELQEDNQESNVGGVTTSTSINDSRHSVGSGSAKSGGIPNEMDNPLDDNPSPCLASAAIPISQDSKTADQKPDALDAITLLPSLTSSAPRNDASFGGKKEKKPPHKAVWQKPGSESPNYTSWYSMTRAERLKQLEEAVASGSDVDWDCEDLDMTHEQLLQYIDSLKESSA